MKTSTVFKAMLVLAAAIVMLPLISFRTPAHPAGDEYIIIGWNDLGMHCANKDFQNMCVLPPYNNFYAHIIRKGTETSLPQVMTAGFNVNYSIPGNTYSVGKTNFWTYAQQLFNVSLSPNTGLTGAGLSGTMNQTGNYFVIEGVPVTPYQDNNLLQENPYQLALLQASGNNASFSTQNVIPVSNEINCVSSGCHTSELAILNAHEREGGFNPDNRPILCADCHGSNALGKPGIPEYKSFSFVIHDKHKSVTNNCYKCHPGPNTQCLRDVMHSAGMVCQDCHGSVSNVAGTIATGRKPWLQEPSCGSASCHGATYAEQPGKLYRQSKGHADLFCSTCHNSPHAILPATQPNDNVQMTALQGWSGTLKKCTVCHGVAPAGPGPHGIIFTSVDQIPGLKSTQLTIDEVNPNPVKEDMTVNLNIAEKGKYYLEFVAPGGNVVATLYSGQLAPGKFSVTCKPGSLPPGMYVCRLRGMGNTAFKKVIVL